MRFEFGDKTIHVDPANKTELMRAVTRAFAAGEGFALATINLDHLVKLSESEPFRAAYSAQDMVVADGNPIVWLSRLAGQRVELVPGSELVEPMARRAASLGVPIGLVGSTEAALDRASQALQSAIPGLDVAAKIAPPMGFDPGSSAANAIFHELEASGARLVFLALGAPKQEAMAARGRQIVPQIGFASIGAGLDFIAGSQTRAPKIVRRLALEWLWRMLTNPKRLFVRYLKCFAILPSQVRAAWRLRKTPEIGKVQT